MQTQRNNLPIYKHQPARRYIGRKGIICSNNGKKMKHLTITSIKNNWIYTKKTLKSKGHLKVTRE